MRSMFLRVFEPRIRRTPLIERLAERKKPEQGITDDRLGEMFAGVMASSIDRYQLGIRRKSGP